MKIPFLDLSSQHKLLHREILDAIEGVLQSQTFILGSEVDKLEQRIAAYCQARSGIGVSSGTDALLVSLMALGIGPGDDVITTAYSFFATAGAIARTGARPRFVDIDPLTYNIDPGKLEEAVNAKTKAIIVVHLFGQSAEMHPILEIAKNHSLGVIEDAAQAIGAEYSDGRRVGSMGILGCLSFFPSKNLGALGDGGMVVTSDPALNEKIKILRAHGSKPKYYHKLIGGNFRLDAIQAAVLNIKLNYLDSWTQQRQMNALTYFTLFKECGLLEKIELRLPKVIYSDSRVPHDHIFNQFIIRIPERDHLQEHLRNKGIGTEIYYPIPFHLQECFQSLQYKHGDFPQAELAAKETLALPVYPGLTRQMQEEIVSRIKDFYTA